MGACSSNQMTLTCILNNQLEDIQHWALRIIYPQMSYKDSITQFNLPTLYDRRELLRESFYKNATRPDSKIFNLLPESTPRHYNLRKPRKKEDKNLHAISKEQRNTHILLVTNLHFLN